VSTIYYECSLSAGLIIDYNSTLNPPDHAHNTGFYMASVLMISIEMSLRLTLSELMSTINVLVDNLGKL